MPVCVIPAVKAFVFTVTAAVVTDFFVSAGADVVSLFVVAEITLRDRRLADQSDQGERD
jgi:hypothetical protein